MPRSRSFILGIKSKSQGLVTSTMNTINVGSDHSYGCSEKSDGLLSCSPPGLYCATSRTVPGSIPGSVTGDFFRGTPDIIMCPEVDSASESEYQGFPLG